jgi:hypothetical protein
MDMLKGRVDTITRKAISGWAADVDEPHQPLTIIVSINGIELGSYTADRPRPDLQTLRIYGEGNHGFWIDLTTPLSLDEDHEIFVRAATGVGALDRGHVMLSKHLEGEKAVVVLSGVVSPQARRTVLPRYVIHVGPHKTGTTYLQRAFAESESELLASGVFYPGISFGWTAPRAAGHTELHRSLATLNVAKLAPQFAELNGSSYRTIVISSEDLIGLSRQALRLLESLVQGHPVDIVFYFRRWSDLLPSIWQETVKQGAYHGFEEFLARMLSDPFQSKYVNFDIPLQDYAQVFGTENLRLISYSHLDDSGIDLYDHFLRSILKLNDVPPVTRDRPNRSVDSNEIEIVRALNELAAQGGAPPRGDAIFHWYRRSRRKFDLLALTGAMNGCQASIPLSDSNPGLRLVHDMVFEKYRNCLVEPCSGYNLFQPAVRELPFVRPGYRFADGVALTLGSLYDAMQADQ